MRSRSRKRSDPHVRREHGRGIGPDAGDPDPAGENGKRAYMDIGSLPTVGFRGLNEAGNQAPALQPARRRHVLHRRIHLRRPRDDRSARPGAQIQAGEAEEHRAQPVFSQNIIKSRQFLERPHPERLQARCTIHSTGNLFNNSAASGGAALSLANLDSSTGR
jgi:hypothetical protein